MKTDFNHIVAFVIILCYTFVYFSSIISCNTQFVNNYEKVKNYTRLESFFGKPKITKNERKFTSSILKLIPVSVFKNTSNKGNNLFVIHILFKLKVKFLLHHQNVSLLRAPPFFC